MKLSSLKTFIRDITSGSNPVSLLTKLTEAGLTRLPPLPPDLNGKVGIVFSDDAKKRRFMILTKSASFDGEETINTLAMFLGMSRPAEKSDRFNRTKTMLLRNLQ